MTLKNSSELYNRQHSTYIYACTYTLFQITFKHYSHTDIRRSSIFTWTVAHVENTHPNTQKAVDKKKIYHSQHTENVINQTDWIFHANTKGQKWCEIERVENQGKLHSIENFRLLMLLRYIYIYIEKRRCSSATGWSISIWSMFGIRNEHIFIHLFANDILWWYVCLCARKVNNGTHETLSIYRP